MKAIELHVITGPGDGRERTFVMSPEHWVTMGKPDRERTEVQFDKWCPPWADDAHEVGLVYEVWR